MPTFKILGRTASALNGFRKYPMHDSNLSNYHHHAKAAAKKILIEISKLSILNLQIDVIQHILDIQVEEDFKLNLYLSHHVENSSELIGNFNYLKTYLDEIFNDALQQIKAGNATGFLTNNETKTFANSRYA